MKTDRLSVTFPHAAAAAAAALVCALASLPASARWTAVNMHPDGVSKSQLFCVDHGVQGGSTQVNGQSWHATIWSGSASSWKDVHPANYYQSNINCISDGRLGGDVCPSPSIWQAAIWSGTSGNCTNLSANSSSDLTALLAMNGDRQFGYRGMMPMEACVWQGTAQSMKVIGPNNQYDSAVMDAAGDVAVGFCHRSPGFGNVPRHACIWKGSNYTLIDVNPSWATNSRIDATDGTRHVGTADGQAILWNGYTPADITPTGLSSPLASVSMTGISGDFASATLDMQPDYRSRAAVYDISTKKWLDLQTLLSPDYSSSVAEDVWSDSTGTYVVGSAYNSVLCRCEAYMWVQSVPEPATIIGLLTGISGIGLAAIRRRRH